MADMTDVELAANGKPKTFADALFVVADFLDLGDKAISILSNGEIPEGNDEMQRDIRRVADQLLAAPELDAQLHAWLIAEDS